MEQMAEERKCPSRKAWSIIGPAIPIALLLLRKTKKKHALPESKDRALLKESNLDIQSAMNKALRYVPGTLIEVELEEEHGMPVWEVEIVPKSGPTREVLIDAKSGDILAIKTEFTEAAIAA